MQLRREERKNKMSFPLFFRGVTLKEAHFSQIRVREENPDLVGRQAAKISVNSVIEKGAQCRPSRWAWLLAAAGGERL